MTEFGKNENAAGTRRSEAAFFRALVANSWDAIEVFDGQGRLVYAGEASARTLGYAVEEIYEKSGFAAIHPDDWNVAQDLFGRAIAAPGVPVLGHLRLKHADGSWRFVEGRLVSYLNDPEIDGVIVGFRDRTDYFDAMRQLEAANARLAQLARTDALTGLANRATLIDTLQNEWRRCERAGSPISAILLDIDYFKRFNDAYGHLGGDDCLRRVATAIRAAAQRSGDLVVRYGGEEFVCLLPDTPLEGARVVAARIGAAVQALAIPHVGSAVAPHVTVSLGVASVMPNLAAEPEGLLASADRALYFAKDQGRNRLASADEVPGHVSPKRTVNDTVDPLLPAARDVRLGYR